MHALFIFFERPFRMDMMLDDYLHIFMANRAGSWDVGAVDHRFRIVFRADIMAAVAIRAGGAIVDSGASSKSVDAVLILFERRELRSAHFVALDVTTFGTAYLRGIALMRRLSDAMFDLKNIDMAIETAKL